MTSTALLLWIATIPWCVQPPAPAPSAPAPPRPGVSPPAADTTVRVWVQAVSGSSGATAIVEVRVSTSAPGAVVTDVVALVHFDPAALTLEEAGPGEWEGPHRVTAVEATPGVLEVRASLEAPRRAPPGPVTFLELTARLVGSPGLQSEVRVEVTELAVDGGAVAPERIVVRSGFVRIF